MLKIRKHETLRAVLIKEIINMTHKGNKAHKVSSKTKSKNKSEKNIDPNNAGSDFNNQSEPSTASARITSNREFPK